MAFFFPCNLIFLDWRTWCRVLPIARGWTSQYYPQCARAWARDPSVLCLLYCANKWSHSSWEVPPRPVLCFLFLQLHHIYARSLSNCFLSRYANQAALDKHRAAPYFQELIKRAPALLAKPLALKVGTHLLPNSAQVARLWSAIIIECRSLIHHVSRPVFQHFGLVSCALVWLSSIQHQQNQMCFSALYSKISFDVN